MKRRAQLLILIITSISIILGNPTNKVSAGWTCPAGSFYASAATYVGCIFDSKISTNWVESTIPNCRADADAHICINYNSVTDDTVVSDVCNQLNQPACYAMSAGNWYTDGGCEHISQGNWTYSACTFTNDIPAVALSIAQTVDSGITNTSLTNSYVKNGNKLYITGTITDPDTQNFTVSYSLSTTTTPSTWTVCRSASSTKMGSKGRLCYV